MGEDLSTAYKIAAGACIMAFILSIGLSLMMIGRNFWNKTADQVTTPVTSMQDTDAFFLASYEKPVPVADIWKMVMRINYKQNPWSRFVLHHDCSHVGQRNGIGPASGQTLYRG